MRHRGNSKIKRQHHMIDELDGFMREIEKWEEITAINPGEIKTCRHNDRLKVTIQYKTDYGVKCLARSHGAVQEFYIVSSDPQRCIDRLSQYILDAMY
ncbi:MAG: hypothetical protein BWY68_00685 [bacterium ADurb.Bin400]|nr:MAG: hypothetical protein BWY68_00685 [bacterium ADurb.Bin400]